MISIENLKYNINGKELFSGLSLSILPASLVRIKGPNGSGKSTLLRMLANIQNIQSGKILKSSNLISYLGHKIGIKDDLSVIEQLEFWASLENNETLVPASLHFMKLEDMANMKCYKLSAGNKQKVGLARIMLSGSMMWFLDEADTSLDEQNLEIYKTLIASKVQNNGIVIYASHQNIFKDTFTIELGE